MTRERQWYLARQYLLMSLIHYRMCLRLMPSDAYKVAPWSPSAIAAMRSLLDWMQAQPDYPRGKHWDKWVLLDSEGHEVH